MEDLVPKVHPLTRNVEPDDPMELIATPVPGNLDYMVQCIVEEFAWMGMGVEEMLGLFDNPEYPVLNGLVRHYGTEVLRERVRALMGALGGIRIQEVIDDEPEPPEEAESPLIQVSLARITGGRVSS
jgi:hypothetical protein